MRTVHPFIQIRFGAKTSVKCKNWWLYLILSVCSIIPNDFSTIRAQSLAHWNITNEEGLPSMTVYSIIQDSTGYIWFGTANGIARYDGSTFKSYKIPGAYNSDISYLNQDALGRIWGINFSGGLFFIEHDSMRLFNNSAEQRIIDYYLTADSIYYFSNKLIQANSLKQLNDSAKIYGHIRLDNTNNSIAGKIDNKLLISTGKNLFAASLSSKSIDTMSFKYFRSTKSIEGQLYFWNLFPSNTIGIWSAKNGTKEFRITGAEKRLEITKVIEYEGFIYITAKSGLFKAIVIDNEIRIQKHYFKGQFLTNILFDTENSLWITTLRNGVKLIPDINTERSNENSVFGFERVTQILPADSFLFLGGERGSVRRLNIITKELISYNPVGLEDIRDLEYAAKSQTLFAIDNNIGVFKGSSTNLVAQQKNYPCKDLDFLSDSALIVGASVASFAVRKNALSQNWKLPSQPTELDVVMPDKIDSVKVLRKRRVLKVLHENKKTLVGYDDKLVLYTQSGNQSIQFQSEEIIVRQMEFNPYRNCYAVLSFNLGLLEIRIENGIPTTTRVLETSTIFSVFEFDEQGYFLGSGNKLFSANYKSTTLNELRFWGGLEPGEIYALGRQGKHLWIGTSKGLLKRNDIYSIKKNETPPKVLIQEVRVNGKTVGLSNAPYKYDENKWEFRIAGIAYKSKGQYRIKYRLKGLSEVWSYSPTGSRELEFSSLPAGNFTLEVVAINESDVGSKVPATYSFEIASPYWLRWWFIALIAIAIVVITTFIVARFSSIKIRHQNEQLVRSQTERQLRQSQLAAVKSQMNPHFIFNALNSIQDYILKNEKRLANNYLGMFADLMRKTLELSNEEMVSLKEELDLLRIYIELEALRFEENDFKHSINIASNVDVNKTKVPPLLLQPYVENAIKHGLFHKSNEKRLTINVENSDTHLRVIIEDNGVGRAYSQELNNKRTVTHKSFSTQANEQRLDLINFGRVNKVELKFEDLHLGELGTRVILLIPKELNN